MTTHQFIARPMLAVIVLGSTSLVWGAPPSVSDLKSDEHVAFYSTYGFVDPAGRWRLRASGVVFERRSGGSAVGQLAQLLGLPADAGESELFQKRIACFLIDHERGKKIVARIGSQTHCFDPTGDDGFFQCELRAADLQALGLEPDSEKASIAVVLKEGDARQFRGAIRLIGPRGWSVISDIDDTVKVTEVLDRSALMANTFLRPFRAVEGMPGAFQEWANRGAAFHYVSASPRQLDGLLAEFFAEAGLPAGTLHLRKFRLGGDNVLKVDTSHDDFKHDEITRILRDFPGRLFILVGDSGQRDPEIYGRLARENPRQIRHVFIRDVRDEGAGAERFAEAFADVPAEIWNVFTEAGDVKAELTRP